LYTPDPFLLRLLPYPSGFEGHVKGERIHPLTPLKRGNGFTQLKKLLPLFKGAGGCSFSAKREF
jgi:hypothetical protein